MYGHWNGLGDDFGAGHSGDVEIFAAQQQTAMLDNDRLVPHGGPSNYDTKGGRVVGGTTIGDADSQPRSSPLRETEGPPVETEELPVEHEDTLTRRRQRKLPNTHATTRRQGGPLEVASPMTLGGASQYTVDVHNHDGLNGFLSALPTKAPRKPLPTIASCLQSGKHTDYPDGIGPPVGRKRPCLFSFCSNALPTTIRTRSLSQLSSEGQTFEYLFAGRLGGRGNAKDGSDLASFAASTTVSRVAIPADKDAGPKDSLLARAAAHSADRTLPKPVDDEVETKTWWIDVLSRTDGEMRMWSKV
jgi:hypothetical protein